MLTVLFLNFTLIQKDAWYELTSLSSRGGNNRKYQVIWLSTKEAIWTEDFPLSTWIFIKFFTGFSLAEPNSSLRQYPHEHLNTFPRHLWGEKNPFFNVMIDVESDVQVHFPTKVISVESEAIHTQVHFPFHY